MRWLLGVLLIVNVFPAGKVNGADWPAFRGPGGNGVSAEAKAPTHWSATENVAWKADLPQPGNSSPIVSNGRVFLTCAQDKEGKQRALFCFDRKSGKQLWVRTVEFDEVMPTHETNPYCGSSPVANGRQVVAFHGSAGLYCYDFAGELLWSKQLGELKHEWGYGSSPIIHADKVILYFTPGENVFLAAFDLQSGKEVWRTQEPAGGVEGPRTDKGYVGSWSTPVIAKINGQDQIVCSTTTRVNGYDPATGKLLWWCLGLRGKRGDLAYSSPLISGDICVATGGFQGPGIGVRVGGQGDITASRLWRNEENPQSIGSGIFIGQHVFRPNAGPGTIDCLDSRTGKTTWTERAEGAVHWGSIVQVGDLLYATDQDGATVIFKPNPERFEQVAVNKLGEHTNSTPAVSDGQLFIRTFERLYCIGQ